MKLKKIKQNNQKRKQKNVKLKKLLKMKIESITKI